MPNSQPLVISALRPTRFQEAAALVAALSLLVLCVCILPFSNVPLGRLDIFLPVVTTAMFLIDSITATLLYAHFVVLRSRALLVLANGYLFTALVAIPYLLTFPGAIAPSGLLGAGLQSAG